MAINVLDLVTDRGIFMRRVSSRDGGEYRGPCPECGGEVDLLLIHHKTRGKGRRVGPNQ
jgi:hypothetical protein